jgi:DNA-binding protein YbaB
MNSDPRIEDLMRTAARVNEDVAKVRGYGQAAGGWVKIEVTGDGGISNLSLGEQTRGMPAHELGRAIREAQHAAITDAIQQVQRIQSQVTQNSYVTTLLNQIGSSELRNPQPPTWGGGGVRQRAAGGMSEQELDASQEQFNSDPLGRRRQR